MSLRGINYDIGVEWGPGELSRPTFDSATTRRELEIIKNDLGCNAVRIAGRDVDRLRCAAEHAIALGLEVWLSPQLHDRSMAETLAYITQCAAVAEGLRAVAPDVVFILGSELTWFMQGIVKGRTFIERVGNPLSMLRLKVFGSHNEPLNAFLATANDAARAVFGGRVTYASAPIEAVDWSPFDVVCLDYYRGAGNRDSYGDRLERHFAHGKPVVITEVGCATYRGAEARGGRAWSIVDPHDHRRLRRRFVRDETLQAQEVIDMLRILESHGVAGVFVFTFAAPALPCNDDPFADLDLASYAIVKTYSIGRGQRYPDLPWEPKAVFDAVAKHYGGRQG